jgi:outer membrane protein
MGNNAADGSVGIFFPVETDSGEVLMYQRLVWAILIVNTMAVSGASAAGVEVAVGGWQHSVSGNLGNKAITEDDIIDLEKDIRFDNETNIMGRLKIDMPAVFPNIYLMAAPMQFEGSGRKSTTLNFGGITFDVNAKLDAEITLNQFDVALYYGLPFVRTASVGKFNIDVGINARFLDLKGKVTGLSGGLTVTEEESLAVPVPMLYFAFQLMPSDALAIEFEGRGIAIGDDSLYSLIGRVRYNFAGPAFIAAGYRYDRVDIDEDDVVLDADFEGPFAELGFKF